MKKYLITSFISAIVILLLISMISPAYAAHKSKTSRTGLSTVSRDPYIGAIVIDAASSKVIFEDNADAKGYPASVVKLMNLLIILEAIEAKKLTLQDKVTISAEVSKIGGSQVYLKENEVFAVEDLIYALTVQSANDAAAALALHYAGSKETFVDLMNKRAKELGMTNTTFHSVHGLPPSRDQQPDVSTPRDIAKLCQELLRHPTTLKYTSTKERPFRTDTPEPFIMRNHNHLLGNFEGCDGFKTGFYGAAGFSIATTASKKGARAIAVIFGSVSRKVRDAKARELLSKGLMEIIGKMPPSALASTASASAGPGSPPASASAAVVGQGATASANNTTGNAPPKSEDIRISRSTIKIVGWTAASIFIIFIVLKYLKHNKDKNDYTLR